MEAIWANLKLVLHSPLSFVIVYILGRRLYGLKFFLRFVRRM